MFRVLPSTLVVELELIQLELNNESVW